MLHHVHCMLIALVVVPSMLAAAELMPGEMPIEQVIDHYVQQQLGIRGIQSAPQCDESTLVRRTTLDLAGRIPTQVEAQAFAASPESDKRVKLVDRLMASPDFAYHFRNGLEGILSNGANIC
jgi:hypothetical protein